jgi:hypothetical protein
MYYLSIKNAEDKHNDCIEYISIRADYIMLKNVILKNMKRNYLGIPWINDNAIPDVDVFFIISKSAVPLFKKVLKKNFHRENTDSHYILSDMRQLKVNIYIIWDNYKRQQTGISYNEYIQNIYLHKNRPFNNYMRDR